MSENSEDDVDLSEAQLSLEEFNTLSRKRKRQDSDQEVYTIRNRTTKQSRKFRCTEDVMEFDLNLDISSFEEGSERISNIFQRIYDDFVVPLAQNQRIRMNFSHELFTHSVYIPFMHKDDITADMIQSKFENVVQSYKKRSLNEEQASYIFRGSIIVVDIPRGGGRRRNSNLREKRIEYNFSQISNLGFFNYCAASSTIVPIYNNDELCLLHAVLVGKAYADAENRRDLLGKKNNRELKKRVNELALQLGITNAPLTIEMCAKIEEKLKDYQIMVIENKSSLEQHTIYLNTSRIFHKFIYISYSNNHFNVIKSMRAFVNQHNYCNYCKVGYAHIGNHICEFMCQVCLRTNCYFEEKLICKACGIKTESKLCLRIHEEQVCNFSNLCMKCGERKSSNHVCIGNNKWCTNCKKVVVLSHKCFILTDNEKKALFKRKNNTENEENEETNKKFEGYIFFEYETYLDDQNQHIPNLIMAQTICKECLESDELCDDDVVRYSFNNNNDFCNWLFKKKNFIAIAHNLKGYDGSFIIQFIFKNILPCDKPPKFIANGTKTISIQFRGVKLIDSYSFIPMSLEKLPKTFDLRELKKGYFPHMFNNRVNFIYYGLFHDMKYY